MPLAIALAAGSSVAPVHQVGVLRVVSENMSYGETSLILPILPILSQF